MASDTLYYGGVIPDEFIESFYEDIALWFDQNADNLMARRLLAYRGLTETTEEYEVIKADVGGADVVPGAKNAPGGYLTMGKANEYAKIWRWPQGFRLSEDDLKKDPKLQSQHVEACQSRIFRAEDKAFFSGRAANNITGLQTCARANPLGKIVASGGGGVNTDNIGAWLTTDTNRDVYQDVLNARGKLRGMYRSDRRNLYLLGNADSLAALDQKDPYSDNSTTIAESVCRLFGRSPTEPIGTWAIINDQVTSGYVYIVSKRPDVAELLEAKAIVVDDNYPRQPIGNLEVQIFQDVGISFKDTEGFVEIAIT
jgi:hypothetical protein